MLDYLVIAAHPDDETAVAGLLLTAKAQGLQTGLITLTHGEAGGFASAATRDSELARAVALLQLDYFKHLVFPDAGVEFTTDGMETLIPLLREASPRVILSIHPEDYHPDHIAVSRLVDRSVFVAGLKKHSVDGTTWHPDQILYFSLDPRTNRNRPDIIFDITPVNEKKREVLRAYASQEIESFMEELAGYHGLLGGFDRGEGLYLGQPLRLSDPACLLNCNKIGR